MTTPRPTGTPPSANLAVDCWLAGRLSWQRLRALSTRRKVGLAVGSLAALYELALLLGVGTLASGGPVPEIIRSSGQPECGVVPTGMLHQVLVPGPSCDALTWCIAFVLASSMTALILHASWSRSRHPMLELMLAIGCAVLTVVVLHPFRRELGTPRGDLLSSGAMLVLFASALGLMLLRKRTLFPEFVIAAFLSLIVGGVWLRDLRSVPGFTAADEIPVRVMTKDLATGAAFLRPGELVRLRLAPQGELAAQTFSNLHVVGLYAADGHSVSYTGELADNILLSVARDQADPMLAALSQKKQPIYVEGQASPEPAPLPVPTAERHDVALPLPAAVLRPLDPALGPGDNVVVVIVDQLVGDSNRPVVQTHFYNAKLSQSGDTYFATLDRGYADSAVKMLAEQLAAAHDIYILPALTSPSSQAAPEPAPAVEQ